MEAGKLRHRVTFQARSSTRDTVGQQLLTWTDAFTVWAAVEGLSVRETLAAQAVRSEVTSKITMRYRAEFANPATVAALRAIYDGRIFNIHGAVDLDGRKRSIELEVSEGLNNG